MFRNLRENRPPFVDNSIRQTYVCLRSREEPWKRTVYKIVELV